MSTYAIAEIAGLQYKITNGQEFQTQKVIAKKDKIFQTDKVLFLNDGKKILVGSPYVKGASVICEVLKEFRGEKTIAYKYRKRKSSRWKKGHRQDMCILRVKEINTSDKS